MNSETFFSFIIPVYNTQDYIENCVNSIIDQKFDAYEIILINDGSNDNSGEICKYLASNNKRILYFEQSNQGLGMTRNIGCNIANGEYILFIDSDDRLKPNTIKLLFDRIIAENEPDIVEFGYEIVTNSLSKKRQINTEASLCGTEYLDFVLDQEEIYEWYAWKYAFKRFFWKKNQMGFPIGKYEDVSAVPFIILEASRVVSLDIVIYQYYRGRPGAITSQTSIETEKDKLSVIKTNIKKMTCKEDIKDHLKVNFLNNMSLLFYSICILVYSFDNHEADELLEVIKQNLWITSYTLKRYKRQYVVSRLIRIVGLECTCRLLNIRRMVKERVESGK